MTPDRRIGLTTTIPVEVVLAAGFVPVDLNNIFITAADPQKLVAEAEVTGFPSNCCAWIKGIYSACLDAGITRVLGVVQGDCSSTRALLEVLASKGVETLEFAYPVRRDPQLMLEALQDLAARLGTTLSAAEDMRHELAESRGLLCELDKLLRDGRASAAEAHLWNVSSSDFRGDPETYRRDLEGFLEEVRQRQAPSPALRIALAGVPPIASDFFEFVHQCGAHIVYDEVPAEFSMMHVRDMHLQDIYSRYSYPYDAAYRLERLRAEIGDRQVRGVIHYQQSFCHRQITAILLKEGLSVPVLALECDRPGLLGGAARTRLESFFEMLRSA
jgi:benzoyl-CoA reductase/2-hydroxyglutaryl-CoA dehydratase subunit BcrC/BadD/HgdB